MAELIFPNAADTINALEAGQQAGMTQRRRAAAVQAGGLMTGGDYQGAAGALYGAGDFQGGSAVAKAGYDQTEQTMKLQRQRDVQGKIAAGDFAGAYAAAGADADLLAGLDKVAAHAKETSASLAAALQTLKGPNGEWLPPDVAREKYAAIKPSLIQRGLDPKMLDGFDPTPDNLSAIQNQVLGLDKQLAMHKPVVVGRDLVDPATGRELYKGDDYKTVGPGETLVKVGGNAGGAPTAPAAATAPAPSPTAAAASGDQSIPRGLRNNNPLNLTALPAGRAWTGQTGSDGKYVTFDSADSGWAAADQNLQAYSVHHGINTVNGIVGRWAPAGSDGNDPAAYAATVAKAVGVTPDAPLNLADPGVRRKVLEAMAGVENGRPVAFGAAAPHGTATPAAAPAPAMPTDASVVFKGSPQWRSDGQGHLINDATGDRKVDPTAADQVEANPDLVKAIIEGRAPVPTANRAATDPKWQAAMAAAMAQDPTLDAANYGTRVKTRADFATGTAAKTKTALNTALGHAGDLDGQVDGLPSTSFPLVNKGINMVETQTGDPRVKTFELTKEALMHEAMKVFSGSAGSLMEFNQLASNLRAEDSPAQKHAVIRKLVGLLASKMDALGEQYKTGMGKELDQSQIMSPHAQEVFSRISGLPPRAPSAPAPGAQPAGELPKLSPQEAAKLPSGTHFLGLDGVERVRH